MTSTRLKDILFAAQEDIGDICWRRLKQRAFVASLERTRYPHELTEYLRRTVRSATYFMVHRTMQEAYNLNPLTRLRGP